MLSSDPWLSAGSFSVSGEDVVAGGRSSRAGSRRWPQEVGRGWNLAGNGGGRGQASISGDRYQDRGPPTQPGSRNKTEHQKYKVAKTVLSSIYYHNDCYECHLLPPHLELIPAPNRVTMQLHLPTPPLARVSSLHLVCCVTEGPRPGWRERVASVD